MQRGIKGNQVTLCPKHRETSFENQDFCSTSNSEPETHMLEVPSRTQADSKLKNAVKRSLANKYYILSYNTAVCKN